MLVRMYIREESYSITYLSDLTLRKVRLREKLTPRRSYRDNIRLGRVAREQSHFLLTVEIVFGKGKRPRREACSKKAWKVLFQIGSSYPFFSKLYSTSDSMINNNSMMNNLWLQNAHTHIYYNVFATIYELIINSLVVHINFYFPCTLD